MAVLLVAIAVMAVLLSAAMPVWRQMVQRDKEEELVFRGQQYARAVGLFERKFANAPPPSIDVLVQQKFLRKKYKDPITNDDFVPIGAAQTAAPAQAGRAGSVAQAGQQFEQDLARQTAARGSTAAAPQGGVIGVVSKSPAQSIRVYNGRTRYNEWTFVYAPPTPTPGTGGAPGTGAPGQRGQPQRGGPQQGGPGAGGAGGPGGRGQGQGGPNRGGPPRGGLTNPFQPPVRGR